MFKNIYDNLHNWLVLDLNIDIKYVNWLENLIIIVGVLILSLIVDFLAKKIILQIVIRFTKRTKNTWDDVLLEHKVFTKLSHLVPAIFIYAIAPYAFFKMGIFYIFVQTMAKVYMVAVFLMAFNAFLKAVNIIYEAYPISKIKPIRGYLQVVKIVVYFICTIVILSFLLQKSPMYFLGGLGALAAVLMLVFKDTILGFVASIQLSANDMVRIGDWITMTRHGADGNVIEMNLTTVKVQNFDKTITMIPTYALIAESFQNWRGMEQSGVRRIRRIIKIDINSVKPLDAELISKMETNPFLSNLIKPYIAKLKTSTVIKSENGNVITNLTIFRLYFEQLVKNNPNIDENDSILIRNLDPDDKGIPIELYAFSKVQAWTELETLTSEIFEHIYAILSEFDLRLFQLTSGYESTIRK